MGVAGYRGPGKNQGGRGCSAAGGGGDLRPRAPRFCRGRRLRRARARCCYTTPSAARGIVPRCSGICRDCVRITGRVPPAEESRLTRRDFRGCSAADRREIVARIARNCASRGTARAPGRRSRLRTRRDGPPLGCHREGIFLRGYACAGLATRAEYTFCGFWTVFRSGGAGLLSRGFFVRPLCVSRL